MEMNEELKAGVRCDACGCAFVPELLSQREGEIEYTFFRCDFCGKAYMVSVTDEALRESIRRYSQLAMEGAEHMTEEQIQEARDLLASNIRRAQELRTQYLGEEENREETYDQDC